MNGWAQKITLGQTEKAEENTQQRKQPKTEDWEKEETWKKNKQNKTHRYRAQIGGCQKGRGWG